MTTHDRDKVIAAAEEAGITYSGTMPEIFNSQDMLAKFYAIAFESGRVSRDAEVAELKEERDTFYMDYRIKCDEQTKALYVERNQLREQVTLLRDYLAAIRKAAMTHDAYWVERMADQALAATDDLNDLILCHAEPVGYYLKGSGFFDSGYSSEQLNERWKPVFSAWEPKK